MKKIVIVLTLIVLTLWVLVGSAALAANNCPTGYIGVYPNCIGPQTRPQVPNNDYLYLPRCIVIVLSKTQEIVRVSEIMQGSYSRLGNKGFSWKSLVGMYIEYYPSADEIVIFSTIYYEG